MVGLPKYAIDADIRRAATLDASFYRDPAAYRHQLESVFARSWHFLGADDPTPEQGSVAPATLLPGSLDEPLVYTHAPTGERNCLANVCSHRANILVGEPCRATGLRCRYHGRRFALDGRFVAMPEFESALDFPSADDDLKRVPHASWGPMRFAGVSPRASFDEWLGPFRERLAFVPWERLQQAGEPQHYQLAAHWALYCDNYLEGLHVPFVHAGLNETLEYGSYTTELERWGSLQVGFAKKREDELTLPASHPDAGRSVAAYYAFLFPATMINVYAWGVSINAIRPLAIDRTQITYVTLVHDAQKRSQGAGADLHRVELEDEAIVEQVQRGIRSRFYQRGRFSPSRETGVHHFHSLLAEAVSEP